MIGRLITGDANVKNLSGPLSIAQFSGKSGGLFILSLFASNFKCEPRSPQFTTNPNA